MSGCCGRKRECRFSHSQPTHPARMFSPWGLGEIRSSKGSGEGRELLMGVARIRRRRRLLPLRSTNDIPASENMPGATTAEFRRKRQRVDVLIQFALQHNPFCRALEKFSACQPTFYAFPPNNVANKSCAAIGRAAEFNDVIKVSSYPLLCIRFTKKTSTAKKASRLI